MNTLEELNNHGSELLFVPDDAPFTVEYRVGGNQAITILEDENHNVPIGINIVKLNSAPSPGLTYTLDVSNVPGTVVSWADESTLTFSNVGDVYTVTGIYGVAQWDRIKSPTIVFPYDYSGTTSYSAIITEPDGTPYNWGVSVTVTDTLDVVTGPFTALTYDENGPVLNVTATTNPANYHITEPGDYYVYITMQDANGNYNGTMSTTTIGAGSFIYLDGVMTLQGSAVECDAALDNLTLTLDAEYELDFELIYEYNLGALGVKTTLVQTVTNNWAINTTVTTNYQYTLNDPVQLIYSFSDNDTDAETYSVDISTDITNSGVFNVDGQDQPVDGICQVSGTKAEINALVINYTTPLDYKISAGMNFKLIKNTSLGDKVIADEDLTLDYFAVATFEFIGGGEGVNAAFQSWFLQEFNASNSWRLKPIVVKSSGAITELFSSYGPTPSITYSAGTATTASWPRTAEAADSSGCIWDLSKGGHTYQAELDSALSSFGGTDNMFMFFMNPDTGFAFTTGTQDVTFVIDYAVVKGLDDLGNTEYSPTQTTILLADVPWNNISVPGTTIWSTDALVSNDVTFTITDNTPY